MNWTCNARLLMLMGFLSWQIGCSHPRPIVYVTGMDYIRLKKGDQFQAPRDMTLATEAVVQEKSQQILDLIKVNQQLHAEMQFLRSQDGHR